MSYRSLFIACFVALACFIDSSALLAQVRIETRFVDDDRYVCDVETQIRQTVDVGGVKVKTEVDQAMAINVSVGAVDRDGRRTLSYAPQQLTVVMDVNDQAFRFDSRNKTQEVDVENTMFVEPAKLFDALSKSRWSVTLDEDGKVVAFDGKEDILDSLDEQAAEALAHQFDEDYLKRQAQNEFDMLPQRAVRTGQRWKIERELRLEAGQTLKSTVEFTYVGSERRPSGPVHRIKSKTVDARLIFSEMAGASIQSQELKIIESGGSVIFDPRVGDVIELDEKLRVKGDLAVEIDMVELNGTIDLAINTRQKRRP